MVKKKRRGKTSKEIDEISQRLYGGTPSTKKPEEPSKGRSVSKEEQEATIERLYEKDPHLKRKELMEKAQQTYDKDRGEEWGYQKIKDKDAMEALTGR